MNAQEIKEHRMRDTFGGYDWGNPIRLWTIRARREPFTIEQLRIAERAQASREANS